MIVKLNSNPIDVADETTLSQLLEGQQIQSAGIATAVNGNVVPASMRESAMLNPGDEILVIKAFYGG